MRSTHKMTFAALAVLLIAGQAAASGFTAISSRQLLQSSTPPTCSSVDNTWSHTINDQSVSMCESAFLNTPNADAPTAYINFLAGPAYYYASASTTGQACMIPSIVNNVYTASNTESGFQDHETRAAYQGDSNHPVAVCPQVTRTWRATTPFINYALSLTPGTDTTSTVYTLLPSGSMTMSAVHKRLHKEVACGAFNPAGVFPGTDSVLSDVNGLQASTSITAKDSCQNDVYVQITALSAYTKVPNACAAQAIVQYNAQDCNGHSVTKQTTMVISPPASERVVDIQANNAAPVDLFCKPTSCAAEPSTRLTLDLTTGGSSDTTLMCYTMDSPTVAKSIGDWIGAPQPVYGCDTTYGQGGTFTKTITLEGASSAQPVTSTTTVSVDWAAVKTSVENYKAATISFTATTDCASKCSTVNLWMIPCRDNDNVTYRRLMK